MKKTICTLWYAKNKWGRFLNNKVQDISHSFNPLNFAYLSYKMELGFTKEDMIRFKNTFKINIVKGNGNFADNVDGSGLNKYKREIVFWRILGEFDHEVYQMSTIT
jgi:hypothetical protein